LNPKSRIADSLRLRADKVYAIRRTPQNAANMTAAITDPTIVAPAMMGEIMTQILAGPAELC
jgi:hypothetical protein